MWRLEVQPKKMKKNNDERNLIRLGNSSYAISLPIKWIRKANLGKGDKIELIENSNGELIVSPEFKEEEGENGKETLDLEDENQDEMARDIISAYIKGSKYIEVKINNKEQEKKLKKILDIFLNLEIVKREDGKILLEDLLDFQSIDIRNFLKRIDNNLKEMFSLLKEYLKNDGGSIGEEIKEIDRDITKIYFFVWKYMNMGIDNPTIQSKMGLLSSSFVNIFWAVYNMEDIGDEIKHIPEISNGRTNKKVMEFVDQTIENYNRSMDAFLEGDKQLARKSILDKKAIMKKCNKLIHEGKNEGLVESLRRINLKTHDISKIVFYGFGK